MGKAIDKKSAVRTPMTKNGIHDSEAKYRRLFETAQDGILILNAETGAITDANPFIIDSLGYSLKELKGKRLWELGAFNDVKESKSAFEELQRVEYIRYDDLPLKSKNGRTRQVEFVSNSYTVNDQKVIQCNIRDITDRKTTEQYLQQSEQRYRGLFESSMDGILILDAESGSITDANPYFLETFGYPIPELIGKRLWELDLFRHVKARKTLFRQLQHNDLIRHSDILLETGNGTSLHVELLSSHYIINGTNVIQINIRDISARILAAETVTKNSELLRQSEERYRRLFETAQDGILILDAETGAITDANPFIMDLLRYSEDELIGKRLWEIGAFADVKDSKNAFEELQRKEYIRYEDLPLKTKDGRNREVEFVSNVYTVHGKKVIQCNIRDITERKLAEHDLNKSQMRYHSLFENMMEGYAYCEIIREGDTVNDFIYREVNNAFETLTGLKDVSGKKVSEVIPGVYETDPDIFALYKRVASTGVSERHEIHLSSLNIWLSLSVYSFQKDHFVVVFDNITKRKLAEETINYERNLLRSLMESIPDQIYFKDIDSRFIRMSRSVAEKFGGSDPAQMIGKKDSDFFAAEHARPAYENEQNIIETGRSLINMEEKETWPDGTVTWASTTKLPLRDAAGSIIGTFGISRDITERKRIELERLIILKITQGITSTTNLRELFKLINHALKEVMYAENCFIALHDPKTDLFSFPYFVDQFDPQPEMAAMHKNCTAYVFRTGLPLLLTDEIFDRLVEQQEVVLAGTNSPSWLGVPLVTPSKIIGVLVLQSYEKENVYSERDVQFLSTVGNQIAIVIERKRAEDELRESEDMFRRLFNESADPILLLDEGFSITNCNASTVSILGCSSRDSLLNKKPWEVSPERQPDGRLSSEKAVQMIWKTISDGYHRFEWMHVKMDGTELPVEVHLTPIQLKGKLFIYTIWHDLTERKRSERALRESNEKFHQLADNISDAFWIRSPDLSEVQYVSPAFEKIWGRTVESLYADPFEWISFIHEEDRERVKGEFDVLTRGTSALDIEYRIRRPDDEIRWVHVRGLQVRNTENALIRHIGIVTDITERKRSDQAYESTYNQLTNLYNNLTEAVFSVDTVQNTILQVSPAHFAIFGHQPEEFYSNPNLWFEIINTEDKPLVEARMADLPAGKVITLQYRVLHPDGSQRWIESVIKPTLADNGSLIRLDGIASDITERKVSEVKLVKSEEKYRGIFDNVQDVYFETLLDGTIIELSPSIGTVSKGQYRREDLVGHSMFDYYNDEGERKALIAELQLHGSVSDYEISLKNRDGSIIACSVSSKFRYNALGTPEKIIGSLRDITGRKNAEKQITLLAHTLKSVAECVSITDTHNIILFVNNAFMHQYGYSEIELLGNNIEMVWSPNNPAAMTDGILAATIAGGWSGELLNRAKDGHEFPVSLSTSFVRDETGTIVGLVGISNDITGRKKFEQELLQSQKIQSIGTLAGGIAHDFNNILAIILGYSGLLEKSNVTDKKKSESIAAINQAVKRGSSLVSQILTFARKTDVSSEPVNIVDLVMELVSMLQQTFPKIITFRKHIPADIHFILADHTQIHQALLNLCVNARDAMPNGGSITIEASRHSDQQMKELFPASNAAPYICISVADTGEGMIESTKNRIFDPFYTTKEQGKGTGLGLSVVYGIVQAHLGFVSVDSQLGKGTVFKLYFPESVTSITSADVNQELPYEFGGNETILVVEDEELLLSMVTMVLELKGYTIIVAHDGAEAVEIFRQRRDAIALVITDLGLPVMTGNEEYRRLIEIDPHVKVIFASGFYDPQVKTELIEAGGKYFIQKPYQADELLSTIREALK